MPVENPVTIEEVIKEGTKNGSVSEISTLTKEQSIGLLSARAKEIDQPADVVSVKGVGRYGLTKKNLEDLGIFKKGIGASDDPIDLKLVLSDASVFTSKYGVNNINDILSNEALQSELTQKIIDVKMTELSQQGILTGDESPEEVAAIASLSTNYTPEQIKNYKTGTGDSVELTNMNKTADTSKYAVNLVDTKAASTLTKIQGIGGGTVSAPVNSVDTIKTPSLDLELDKFIGSKRIESAVKPVIEEAENILNLGDLF